ncbi:MAG: hypothetical protein Q4F95_03800 [Oscillospiraceae bacterium]|nr:hypothetical protein [Oscillospiraceae bacterium]
MKNKQMAINMVASIFSFIVQMCISFFVTPYIRETLGYEAYGYITLTNNIVNMATIVTVAINSMASRFIAVSYHSGDMKKANEFYSSVFMANVVMSAAVVVFSGFIIFNLNFVLGEVTPSLTGDVKITFALASLNLIVTLLSTVFNIAAFVKNKLYLNSIRQIIGNLLKAGTILGLFIICKPKIFFVSISALVFTVFCFVSNYSISKRLLPEFKIRRENFKMTAIKALITAGIWNSVNNLSTTLLTGLDLWITKRFIGEYENGLLSIAKTIPTNVILLLSTIGGIFAPQFTQLYSQHKTKELTNEVTFSIKVFSLIMVVPIAGFIAFGTNFYQLWITGATAEEIRTIQILSILSLGPNLVSSYIYSLYSINTVTNKLKVPVILTLILSVLSTVIVFILLSVTDMGVYAVAGVSSAILLLRVLFFVPTYAAHNLKLKLTTFYPPFLRAIFCSAVLLVFFYTISHFFKAQSWGSFLVIVLAAAVLGYVINFLIVLNKSEKEKVMKMLKNKLRRA